MSKRPKTRQHELAPIFIVTPPRTGGRLLAETLRQAPHVYTRDDGAADFVDSVSALHPSARGWTSSRLTAEDSPPGMRNQLSTVLGRQVRDRNDRFPSGEGMLTVLEQSPLHALRVPFLAATFRQARFVYVHREAAPTIASMAEAWRSQRFVPYPALPGWYGPPWSFALIEDWRALADRPIEEIAARQWQSITSTLLADLDQLGPQRWTSVSYARFASEPQAVIRELCGFLGLAWDRELTAPLPLSTTTITPPRRGKWREKDEVQRVLPLVHELATQTRERFGEAVEPIGHGIEGLPAEVVGFTSRSSPTFTDLLRQAHSSLLISTYQSGRLILARANDAGLNTHFRGLQSPMGIAVGKDRFAVGTRRGVNVYRNHAALASTLDPAGTYDGCYLPLNLHITGDMRVHEMAYVDDELWVVSTRFSCLATLDDDHSFRPRWKPPFISEIKPEDRCHLNGCTTVDGEMRFVSAIGVSDAPGGWRDHKASGGVIIDVPSGEIVVKGLSMPHSPRWYADSLWILESGKGTLGLVDLDTGDVETVATLPGFTRGLTFVGHYALVGLSQVRESIFRGLPVAQQQERFCGVWVVDTRTGETAGFLRFDGVIQEIFDVQLLAGQAWPELGDADSDLANDAFLLPDEAVAL